MAYQKKNVMLYERDTALHVGYGITSKGIAKSIKATRRKNDY
jgi:hypothetical protein